MNKKISIIMGVYNAEKYLKTSIDSIINQTYTNWEFIICDDASTDDTYSILEGYEQKYPDKFIILRNDQNYKLAYSLNKCLAYSTGSLIARMDADDISKPDRLEKQVKYLESNKNVDLVGSAMQRFSGDALNDVVLPQSKKPDKTSMKKGTPFCHATILTYKSVYDKVGGYTVEKRTERGQDYDLWFKFFYHGFTGENILDPLYLVREDYNAIKRRTPKSRLYTLQTTKIGYKMLGFSYIDYISKAIQTLFKSAVPYKVQYFYRKIQAKLSN